MKCCIIYNGVKDILRFFQAISRSVRNVMFLFFKCHTHTFTHLPIFGQHLVKFGCWHQKQDRINWFVLKAFDPFTSLWSLATNVNKNERNVLQRKKKRMEPFPKIKYSRFAPHLYSNCEFMYTFGCLSTVQNISSWWYVIDVLYSIDFVQKITNGITLENKKKVCYYY